MAPLKDVELYMPMIQRTAHLTAIDVLSPTPATPPAQRRTGSGELIELLQLYEGVLGLRSGWAPHRQVYRPESTRRASCPPSLYGMCYSNGSSAATASRFRSSKA
jgi:hypothetical protein